MDESAGLITCGSCGEGDGGGETAEGSRYSERFYDVKNLRGESG